MKKIIALILSVVITFGCTSAFAAENDGYSDYPVIIVPGIASSPMYRIDEQTGEKIHVWNIDINEILGEVRRNIIPLGKALADFAAGDVQELADRLGSAFVRLYGDLACKDDGSSLYDLHRYHTSAAETQDSVLIEGDSFCRFEPEIADEIAKIVGRKNIFHFACDFRMSNIECAKELDDYIKDVKQFTGKDKVNIYAVSHGGQITGTYLSLYGSQGDVNNAVLTIPALGGALLAYDILNGGVKFDEELLLRFVQFGMMYEEDFNLLLTADRLGILDPLIDGLIPYVHQILLNWGCMWDFVPTKYYEQLKSKLLDSTKNAEIIAESDYVHYEIMANYAQNFKKAEAAGTHISIIAGSSYPAVTGTQENSDALISVNSSTGAATAPYTQRFSDGYTQLIDTGLYQVSPKMDIDLSCGYLPYNTWIVDELFHGMTIKDPYAFPLAEKLLLTDEIKDVTSDPNYPQFHASMSRSLGVYAAFNKSADGFLSSDDDYLTVTNLSTRSDMRILSITGNTGLCFDYADSGVIPPGGSVKIPVSGQLDEESFIKKEVTITYAASDNITPLGERTLNFTLMNGEKAEYTTETPYSPLNGKTVLETLAGEKLNAEISRLGLSEILNMVTNIISSWILLAVKYISAVI